MYSERWNEPREIIRALVPINHPSCGAGPLLYHKDGVSYADSSSRHVCFIGNTGKGKSESGSLPLLRAILSKNESVIVTDPKGELYHHCACHIPAHYQKFILDFRYPQHSPTKFNPLSMIYRLYTSDSDDNQTLACELLNEMASACYPITTTDDHFWPQSAANFFQGLVYALMEHGRPEEIHLASVIRMMGQVEEKFGAGNYIKALYDKIPKDSPSKQHLSVYVTGPTDTRGSILSVATNGLTPLCRSKGMLDLLSHDTLNILDLDVNRPFLVLIILPDETNTYDSVAGLLISQLSQHLIRQAQNLGSTLPIRCNFILEELSSVGKSIPKLDRLMAIGRSRNLRLFLILQAYSQLEELYGKSKADAILSCVGITVGFSNNNWDTLKQWSQRCGERVRNRRDRQITEPLITPTSLSAMPIGTAIVLMDNGFKFISHFPRYKTLFDTSDWQSPESPPCHLMPSLPVFDLTEFVKEQSRRRMLEHLEEAERRTPVPPHRRPEEIEPLSPLHGIDLDALMRDIDKKIAELDAQEAKERAEKKKKDSGKKKKSNPEARGMNYQVTILQVNIGDRYQTASIVARERGLPMREGLRLLDDKLPITLSFHTKAAADKVAEELTQAGASLTRAVITEEDLI